MFDQLRHYYCYRDDCSALTEGNTSPFGVMSTAKRKRCPHCKRYMTSVSFSQSEHDD